MMNPIEKILNDFKIMILDGAFATELESHGCDLHDELWSAKVLLENPELIKQVHMDYFTAGADCVITSSYQATVEGFIKRGLSKDEALKLISRSVLIAKEARDEFWRNLDDTTNRPYPLVAASVGPYGAFLADGSEYRGDYKLTENELMNFHRLRMKTLIDAGADLIACETIPCLTEARAIVRLLKEFPGIYAWISFSAKDNMHISSGDRISDCAEWLNRYERVVAIGVNCTPPKYILSLINEIHSHTEKPIVVYPNSGETYSADSHSWNGASHGESFGSMAQLWYKKGARLIGGCCRTTPEDIRAITAWARK